jgi:hypothetical protein
MKRLKDGGNTAVRGCMRGAGNVAHMETIKVRTKFFLGEAEL